MTVPPIVRLADQQLAAYNAGDIDAFCACYADDVVVLDASGAATIAGMDAFRPRYASLFADHVVVRGDIVARMVLGPHLVEHEVWERQRSSADPLQTGEVLVRYTLKGAVIGTVQFLDPGR